MSASSDCLFCRLAASGDHLFASEQFVAIRDIAPKAETHLLVLPKRHLESFREVEQLSPEEAKAMLDFVAEAARVVGLSDYRLIVNVGRGGGQTIDHLHWHLLGGRRLPGFA